MRNISTRTICPHCHKQNWSGQSYCSHCSGNLYQNEANIDTNTSVRFKGFKIAM